MRYRDLSALCLLACLGVGPCDEEMRKEDELIKPRPANCEYLRRESDKEVAACKTMCPDESDACAAESCITKYIARWIEARPACPKEALYNPAPNWPRVRLIVE